MLLNYLAGDLFLKYAKGDTKLPNLLGKAYDLSPQSHAFREQSEWSEQMAKDAFERESTYNSPEAQMQRYKDAGLNPNLMYGQGNAGNTNASVPSASYATPQMPQIFGMIMQVAGFIEDQKLKKAQRENLYSTAMKSGEQMYSEQIRHMLLEQQYNQLEKMNPMLRQQLENLNKMAPYQLSGAGLKNEQTKAVISNLLSQGKLMEKDAPIKDQVLKSKEYENRLLEAQTKLTEQGITNPQQFFQFLLMALMKTFQP